MIPFEEALSLVLAGSDPVPAELVPLGRGAGRVLREEVAADLDLPPFDTTAMDGWAVRSAETAHAPTTLRVCGGIGAGRLPAGPLPPGAALKVMTGAPLPAGADAIVPVESAEERAKGTVTLLEAPRPGAHLRRQGEVLRAGTPLLRAGRALTPTDILLAASAGRDGLLVSRRLRASLLVTGDEVVPCGERPGPGKIRNTNGPLLVAALERAGAVPRDLGCCSDDAARLHEVLGTALDAAPDLLLTTGGVSAGDYDLVGGVLSGLGCRTVFHRIATRPARPLLFARRGGTLVFGLPGNPVSSAVAFDLLVRPAMRALSGALPAAPEAVDAFLDAPAQNPGRRLAFLPAHVRFERGRLLAAPIRTRGSHDVAAHAAANAYVILPPGSDLAAGDAVRTYLGGEGTTLG